MQYNIERVKHMEKLMDYVHKGKSIPESEKRKAKKLGINVDLIEELIDDEEE